MRLWASYSDAAGKEVLLGLDPEAQYLLATGGQGPAVRLGQRGLTLLKAKRLGG